MSRDVNEKPIPTRPTLTDADRGKVALIGSDALMKTRERGRKATKACRRWIKEMFEYLRTSDPVAVVAPGVTISSEEVTRLRPHVIESQAWRCEATCGLCRLHGLNAPR